MKDKKSACGFAAAALMLVFGIAKADALPFWKDGVTPSTTRAATAVTRKPITYFSSRCFSSTLLSVKDFNSNKFGLSIIVH